MNTSYRNRIRIGVLALVLSGVMGLAGELMRGPLLDPGVNPSGFALAAAVPSFGAAWVLILLSATLAMFGTLALFGHLAGGPADGAAFWGLALSLAGGALFLVFTGAFAFADPVVGQLYAQGDHSAIAVAVAAFYQGPATSILYPAGLLGTLGSVLMGIAIWRSGSLPRWAAILFAVHTPLLAFASGFSYPLELLGGVTLLLSALWLAPALWRPAGRPSAAAQAAMA